MEVISASSACFRAHRGQKYERGYRTVDIKALLERMDCEEVISSLMKGHKPQMTGRYRDHKPISWFYEIHWVLHFALLR